jgi:hypothetical protein
MKRTILSVCNWPLSAVRDYSKTGVTAFKTTYEIPAVPKGEYALLEVGDAWDRYHVSEGNYSSIPVYGEHLADDLVHEWSGDTAEGACGVIVLKGDQPTPEEKALAVKQHVAYCTAMRNKAMKLWAEDKRDQATSPSFVLASQYLGTPNDPWCLPQDHAIQVKCQWCGKLVDEEAVLCSYCGKITNFNRYQQLMELQDEMEKKFKASPPPPLQPATLKEPAGTRS